MPREEQEKEPSCSRWPLSPNAFRFDTSQSPPWSARTSTDLMHLSSYTSQLEAKGGKFSVRLSSPQTPIGQLSTTLRMDLLEGVGTWRRLN